MHRIDDPTAVPTLPAPRPEGTPGYFTGGSPGSSGFAATVVRYEFMNALQEELCAIIEAAGITLDKTNNAQVLAALRKVLRFKLFQDITYYVSPTGNDSNDGLTPATAFATGSAAWNKAIGLDLNGHNLTIQFANGNYSTPIFCQGVVLGLGAGNGISLIGNIAQPNLVNFNMTNANCLTASDGANVRIAGMTFTATGTSSDYVGQGNALCANGANTVIAYDHVQFGACSNAHCLGQAGTTSSGPNPYSIIGQAPVHLTAIGGSCNIAEASISITGNPHFSSVFAYCYEGSIYVNGAAFAGAATGKRYLIQANGVSNGSGGNVNFFPGDVAGTTDTGGQYM